MPPPIRRTKIVLTQAQKEEHDKCATDPIYFIKKYVFIEHKIRGVIPFDLFPCQIDLIKDFLNPSKKLQGIVKSRQLGASTTYAAISLWLILFYESKEVAIVATDVEVAMELHQKVTFMYESLPDWLRKPTSVKNMKTLKIKQTGSRVRAFPYNKKKGVRSIAATYVIMDEAAFIENADKLFATIKPSLATGGTCIALSSPSTPDGWFYDTYKSWTEGKSNWHFRRLPWWTHPERLLPDGTPNYAWRKAEEMDMGKRLARMEYDAEFGFASDTFFDPEVLEYIQEFQIKTPKRQEGKLWIWEDPDPELTYLVTVDVAEGGADDNVVHVFKENTMEQVAEYMNNENYKDFRVVPLELAQRYNNATLMIEANSVGTSVVAFAHDLVYPNLFHRGSRIEKKLFNTTKREAGWKTTPNTRPQMIKAMEGMLESYEDGVLKPAVVIRSERTLNQMKSFKDINRKPQAEGGAKDDAVMALSLACIHHHLYGVQLAPASETRTALQSQLELYALLTSKAQRVLNERKEILQEVTEEDGSLNKEKYEKLTVHPLLGRNRRGNALARNAEKDRRFREDLSWLK